MLSPMADQRPLSSQGSLGQQGRQVELLPDLVHLLARTMPITLFSDRIARERDNCKGLHQAAGYTRPATATCDWPLRRLWGPHEE